MRKITINGKEFISPIHIIGNYAAAEWAAEQYIDNAHCYFGEDTPSTLLAVVDTGGSVYKYAVERVESVRYEAALFPANDITGDKEGE